MSALREAVLHFVDERIRQMLQRPAAWGSEENVELQVLQLVEVRALALHPDTEPRRIFKLLQRAYERFVEDAIQARRPELLSEILQSRDELSRFSDLLGTFVSSWEYANRDENPFEEHDLVVRLTLKDQFDEPPTSMIGHYYETLRRVIRAIERDNPMGRAPREVEQATDFRTPDLQVHRRNGMPARVVMPLRIPPREQLGLLMPDEGVTRVRSAMSHLATVAEWAGADAPLNDLSEVLPDSERRQRVAFQALRLVPSRSDACRLVELGGKEIGRLRPVELSNVMSNRLFEVVSFGQSPVPFDVSGVVRMLDLDQGLIALKEPGSRRRALYYLRLEDADVLPTDLLGQEVRLEGETYRDPLQRTFSVATRLAVLRRIDDEEDDPVS
jgi:hypothetical protein